MLYSVAMDIPHRIEQIILNSLAAREMRVLVLLVLVRKALGRSIPIKVDLPRLVMATLRKLLASKTILDTDGTYSILNPI